MKQKSKNSDSYFEPYLTYDEEILWMDKPSPWQILAFSDLLLIPFSLMWGGFAIFWTFTASASGISFFTLWGVPFVVVGQYMIWGRFIYRYIKRRNTYYAITTQRVLVLNTLIGRNLEAHVLNRMASLTWRGRNLLFGEAVPMFSRNSGMSLWHGELQPGLYGLSDVEDVYHLLQELIQQDE